MPKLGVRFAGLSSRRSAPLSGDLTPGSVWIPACRAAHLLRAAVDPHPMYEVATAHTATVIVVLGDDLAVAAVVGIAPAHRPARGAALPGIHLGLLGELPVAHIELATNLVADDAADHRPGDCGNRFTCALAELITDHTAGNGADHRAGILLAFAGGERGGERSQECQ